MRDFFFIVGEIIRIMRSCELQVDNFHFTLWDLWLAIFWVGAAIEVWHAWRDNS